MSALVFARPLRRTTPSRRCFLCNSRRGHRLSAAFHNTKRTPPTQNFASSRASLSSHTPSARAALLLLPRVVSFAVKKVSSSSSSSVSSSSSLSSSSSRSDSDSDSSSSDDSFSLEEEESSRGGSSSKSSKSSSSSSSHHQRVVVVVVVFVFFFFVLLLLLLLPPLGLSVYFFLSLLPAWTKFYDGGVSFFTLFASKILTQLDSLYNSRVTHLHVEPHYNW